MLKVFIGYDPRQAVSVTTLIHSLTKNASKPLAITPLVLETLPLKRAGLTPFTFSRFLVPYLCNFSGKGLFLDADEFVRGDIAELFALAESGKAVYVRKNLEPKYELASVMLFNCDHPANAILTRDFIEFRANNLHTIGWLKSDDIGDIPHEWNVCIGYDKEMPENPKLIHYTQGVPEWWETRNQAFADEWCELKFEASSAKKSWYEIMGSSKHAELVIQRLLATGEVKDIEDYVRKAGLVKAAAE